MTDARTLNAQRHNEKIARIRANPDLSEHAKRCKIGEIHQEALAEHSQLTEEAREEAVRSAERKVLGISLPRAGLRPREGPHRPLLPGRPRPCRARSRRHG